MYKLYVNNHILMKGSLEEVTDKIKWLDKHIDITEIRIERSVANQPINLSK